MVGEFATSMEEVSLPSSLQLCGEEVLFYEILFYKQWSVPMRHCGAHHNCPGVEGFFS